MRNNHETYSGMIVSNTRKCFDEEEDTKIDWRVIKLKIVSVLLVLNDSTVQTVTLSSEGLADETYPDSMGEYQLAGEIRGNNWYRHKDREDRFLMYNNLGNEMTE